MYATGQVLLPFFAIMSMLIAVPTGTKFFNWIGTMWGGHLTFETPMLWSLGFLVTFLFGGLTGVIIASPALDFHVTDTYFIVAHFHYTVFGTVVFAMFAGFYFWWPKLTGRMLDERLGKIHFWMLFIGFQTTFLIQHLLGIEGMARRYADYLPQEGFQPANVISTAGAVLLGTSTLPFLYNIWRTWRYARSSRPTTRGATARPWSGPPPVRRRGTTSAAFRGSAPSAPRSTCTIPRPPHQPNPRPAQERWRGPEVRPMTAERPSCRPPPRPRAPGRTSTVDRAGKQVCWAADPWAAVSTPSRSRNGAIGAASEPEFGSAPQRPPLRSSRADRSRGPGTVVPSPVDDGRQPTKVVYVPGSSGSRISRWPPSPSCPTVV